MDDVAANLQAEPAGRENAECNTALLQRLASLSCVELKIRQRFVQVRILLHVRVADRYKTGHYRRPAHDDDWVLGVGLWQSMGREEEGQTKGHAREGPDHA